MDTNRNYLQVTINIPEHLAEEVSDALMDAGALSVAIQDAFAGTTQEQPIFGEPGEQTDTLWADSAILCLFDPGVDFERLLKKIYSGLGQEQLPAYETEIIDDQDWVRLTQSQFEPIQISERLWITPSWHDKPAQSDAFTLELDPGLAFGTGSHPTTKLCLLWLEKHLCQNQSVLDYGCGSGILAIFASKLGAKPVIGVDIDPLALTASQENAKKNNTPQIEFMLPDHIPSTQFDVVVANILANPLRLLAQLLADKIKTGGQIVLSGILQEQAEELNSIYSQWFVMEDPVFLEGWTRLTGKKQ